MSKFIEKAERWNKMYRNSMPNNNGVKEENSNFRNFMPNELKGMYEENKSLPQSQKFIEESNNSRMNNVMPPALARVKSVKERIYLPGRMNGSASSLFSGGIPGAYPSGQPATQGESATKAALKAEQINNQQKNASVRHEEELFLKVANINSEVMHDAFFKFAEVNPEIANMAMNDLSDSEIEMLKRAGWWDGIKSRVKNWVGGKLQGIGEFALDNLGEGALKGLENVARRKGLIDEKDTTSTAPTTSTSTVPANATSTAPTNTTSTAPANTTSVTPTNTTPTNTAPVTPNTPANTAPANTPSATSNTPANTTPANGGGAVSNASNNPNVPNAGEWASSLAGMIDSFGPMALQMLGLYVPPQSGDPNIDKYKQLWDTSNRARANRWDAISNNILNNPNYYNQGGI